MLTIPADKHTEADVRALFEKLSTGAVFQKEKGKENGYKHFQAFCQFDGPTRWQTVKNELKEAGFDDTHMEPRKLTVAECVDYCSKEDTRIGETVHIGEIDLRDQQGKRTDLITMREQILEGASVDDILLEDDEGKAARYTKYLNDLSAAHDRAEYGNTTRDLDVHYLYGDPGVGKTSYVYSKYPMEDVYRVTDYTHPFDTYHGQPVMMFEEFESQINWSEMLCYLDRYPVELPARYHNHQAKYTTVWITSNLPLEMQYVIVKGTKRKALTRRIGEIIHMGEGGVILSRETSKKVVKPVVKDARPAPRLVQPSLIQLEQHGKANPKSAEPIFTKELASEYHAPEVTNDKDKQ
ncbi:hypothetical protein OZX72_02155 [Bifidobacterium sp. ESL0769]|uniref:hypothetical protein n=1 Tax=Bifidobacterium sp. ESL0769 TaxID=2983229 RepID=UPI0023F69B03|nr:hypothetical protein [Bifidobacterium sp. ESL0769]WEV67818.1 hypothetical protein OZX72_02155 [Bifidobacterium sp. ESL0769]